MAETLPEPASEVERLVRDASTILDKTGSKERDLGKVRDLLGRAAAMSASYAPLYVQRARLAHHSGYISHSDYRPESLAEAHTELDKAATLDPTLADVFIKRALVHKLGGDLGSARRTAEKGVAMAPENPRAHLVLLHVASEQGDVDVSIAAAKRVFELSESALLRSQVCGGLADVYRKLDDDDAVEQMYVCQARHEPNDAWIRGNYAHFLKNRKRYDEAIVMAKEALALMSYGMGKKTLAEAYAGRAMQRAEAGDIPGAEESLALAERTWSRPNADVEVAKGSLEYARGLATGDLDHVAAAKRHFERALAIEPKHWLAKRFLNYERTMIKKVGERKR